jgi:hypothetical protein
MGGISQVGQVCDSKLNWINENLELVQEETHLFDKNIMDFYQRLLAEVNTHHFIK